MTASVVLPALDEPFRKMMLPDFMAADGIRKASEPSDCVIQLGDVREPPPEHVDPVVEAGWRPGAAEVGGRSDGPKLAAVDVEREAGRTAGRHGAGRQAGKESQGAEGQGEATHARYLRMIRWRIGRPEPRRVNPDGDRRR